MTVDAMRRALLAMLSPSGPRAQLIILTFHQVPREHDSISPTLPHAGLFAEQMRWLTDCCNVLPLSEAAEQFRERRLPSRAACITFDDGYADNFDVAAPILAKAGLPATFFVTGGAVEQGIMWNDLVIEGIRHANGDLDLSDLGFGTYRLEDDKSRMAAINDTIAKLKYQQLDCRWDIARSIFARAAKGEPPRLMMTKEQVAALAAQGFDIGSHTINHPILKELSAADGRHEIEASRDWVADVTGRRPTTFAYPNGKPGVDFDATHERMARDAGYVAAVSTRWACAIAGDSLFALPRFTPWERNKSGYWMRLAKTAARSYIGSDD